MDALLRRSSTAAYIAEHLGDHLFTLIDVGCSGGLPTGWRSLGSHLRAVAFDPQRYEIARLCAEETNPRVEYVEGYVGAPADHPLRSLHDTDVFYGRTPWRRLSVEQSLARGRGETPPDQAAFHFVNEASPDLGLPLEGFPQPLEPLPRETPRRQGSTSLLEVDGAEARRQKQLQEENRWAEADLASKAKQIVLPDFLADRGVTDIDFLKIDVDGPDYEILYTMSETLNRSQILGVSLEVNFFGSHLPHHHTFHNMDRFMRAHGFALFALTTRVYSSGALPQPYIHEHPAQTIKGRLLQGDALYVRDFALKIPESDADQVSNEKLAKTAAIFALLDLPSEAVEHLLRFRDRLSTLMDVDHAIELLTQESQRDERSRWNYAEYMAAFKANDPFFFDRQQAPFYDPATGQRGHPLTMAYADVARLHEEVSRADERSDALQAELALLKRSRSWRLTAPLRRLNARWGRP